MIFHLRSQGFIIFHFFGLWSKNFLLLYKVILILIHILTIRIENHYFTNKGFFPCDGWLLEKKNIDKIKHIPTVIVQGRYDVVCPSVSAYELKKAMPSAEMHYTLTGHSGFEVEIIQRLVEATDKFKTK